MYEAESFLYSSKRDLASLHLLLTDPGPERRGAVGARLLESAQRRAGGHGELPQRPGHHLPPGALAPDQPSVRKDGLQLRGSRPRSE